jgi:hypothetical protein
MVVGWTQSAEEVEFSYIRKSRVSVIAGSVSKMSDKAVFARPDGPRRKTETQL